MEADVTRPAARPARLGARGRGGRASSSSLLCVAVAVGFFLYPDVPQLRLLLLAAVGPRGARTARAVFEGFRVPTEHPLAIVAGALLQLFGERADRVWIALILASFLALVRGSTGSAAWRSRRWSASSPRCCCCTRFDFAFLAARGYIDIPYMALVVWAAVLEAPRPRRGLPVFVLLAAAGLLRPEAWLLAGLYWLWMRWRGDLARARSVRGAGRDGAAGLVRGRLAVTGDPLFSLHYTSASAEDLGRAAHAVARCRPRSRTFLADIVKLPVLVAGAAPARHRRLVLAPRRMVVPLVLLLAGLGTFVLDRGRRPVGDRALPDRRRRWRCWSSPPSPSAAGRCSSRAALRRAWCRRGGAASCFVVVLHRDAPRPRRFDNELRFRGDAHAALTPSSATRPSRRAALRPADAAQPQARARRALGRRPAVRARLTRARRPAQRAARPAARASRSYVTSRFAIFKQA